MQNISVHTMCNLEEPTHLGLWAFALLLEVPSRGRGFIAVAVQGKFRSWHYGSVRMH